MIGRYLILGPLLALSPAWAEVYRWVDAEGQVHFSDRRLPGADKLDIQGGRREQTAAPGPTSPDEPYPGPYSQVELLDPAGDQVLEDPAQGVAVSLRLEPPLSEGHQLRLLVDNQAMVLEPHQTQFRLRGLEPGRHRLQIQVLSPGGDQIIAQSAPRVFELRPGRVPGELP